MVRNLVIFLAVAATLASCAEDDEPSIQVFSIEVGDGFLPTNASTWIILSDSEGNLLSEQRLEPGIFQLNANQIPSDNRLNVSVLTIAEPNIGVPGSILSVETYTGIAAGENWTWKLPDPIIADPIVGSFNLQVTNLPPVETLGWSLSKGLEGQVVPSGNIADNGATSEANLVVPLSEAQDEILISVVNNFVDETIPPAFEPKYFLLTDLVNDQQVSLDFNTDFVPFDEQVTFETPETYNNISLTVNGFQDLSETYGSGFIFTWSTYLFKVNEMSASFNTGLNYYQTSKRIQFSDGASTYRKLGAAPTNQDLAPRDLDFQVQNTSFENYAFTASQEFQIVQTNWYKEQENNGVIDVLNWTVYADRDQAAYPVLNSFPPALTRDYPVLSPENLTNAYSRFIFNVDNKTFDDFLERNARRPISDKQLEEVYELTKFN